MKTRIALVEDNHALRQRLADNLAFFTQIDLVLAAPSGESFIAELDKLPHDQLPQVVLMDIQLPGQNGMETTRAVKAKYPEVEVVMHTVFEDDDSLMQAIQAGASGYLLKGETVESIVACLEEVLAGGAPMSAGLARRMLHFMRQPQADERALLADTVDGASFNLSEREIEILQLLVDGHTYTQIADKLFISPQTVKSHIKNIYKKMHVHSRVQAVRKALDNKNRK